MLKKDENFYDERLYDKQVLYIAVEDSDFDWQWSL